MNDLAERMKQQAAEFRDRYQAVKDEIGKVIVGHEEIVHGVLTECWSAGIACWRACQAWARPCWSAPADTLNLQFSRIQFTPDLMPADILGTNMIVEDAHGGRSFQFQKGPIFTQILLADEINRATPKTQSALLETMQEGTVTVAGIRHELQKPFFVLATQNPIEQEGTYPLPEAQLDRFMFKLIVGYSSREELNTIVDRTTRGTRLQLQPIMDGVEIIRWQTLVREVILAPHVQDYIVRLILATHPEGPLALPVTNQYVRWGSSPRGAQTLALAAKVRALLGSRFNVSFEDVRRVFLPSLRHRVLLNFEAQAESMDVDQILLEILEKVPEKSDVALPVATASVAS